jgi:hypothetical protein
MKTVLRILIILVSAIAIGSVALALVNSSGSAASTNQVRFSDRQFPGSGNLTQGQAPTGTNANFRPDRGNRFEGGLFSWLSIIQNLVIVAVLVLIVALFERMLKAMRTPQVARVPVRSSDVERKE